MQKTKGEQSRYGKVPIGQLQIGDVKEEDFLQFLLSFGPVKESSMKTYGKLLRRILLFAHQNSYSIRDVVQNPEEFFTDFARSKGLDEQSIRAPRSVFFRYVVPFLKQEAERGKDVVGEVLLPEKEEWRWKPRKVEREVPALPPPEVKAFFEKMAEEIKEELLRKIGEVKVEKVEEVREVKVKEEVKGEEELRSLGFPCIILFLIPDRKKTVHVVALEKVAEDRQFLKVRGFMVEKWAEDVAQYERYERKRGGTRPQPEVEVYALPKKNVILVKEIEEGVHEPNAVFRHVEPLLRKLLRTSKPSYPPEQESVMTVADYL